MDMVFRGGTVVTSHARFPADVYVKGEKIAAIGTDLAVPEGTKTIDATGKLVLPGAIDAHTHLEFPFNGTTSADDYFAGTRAAACGGVTMVFDFVTQRKGQGIREAVQPRNALCAPKACIDYSFHVALTDLTPAVLEEFADAAAAGLPSFKLYMVYKKDGSFEPFDRMKLFKGLQTAIKKRPVSVEQVNALVEDIENTYANAMQTETTTSEIGDKVLAGLKKLDSVAYVRFASVYKDFDNVDAFIQIISELSDEK